MRSRILQEILDETPQEVDVFVRLYADIVLRIQQIMQEKGISQKELADRMDKKPSEISKWLNGEHNFTLRSLARLQAELGEVILNVPTRETFVAGHKHVVCMTVFRNETAGSNDGFDRLKYTQTFTNASANAS